MNYQDISSTVYLVLSLLFLVAALFIIRKEKRSRPFFIFGIFFSLILALVTALSFFIYNIPALTLSISFISVQVFILGGAGAYLCSKLSLPSVPYLRYALSRFRRDFVIRKFSISLIILSFLAVILYSVALFALLRPTSSPLLEDFWSSITEINRSFSPVILVAFALGEEIIFRLFLQNLLASYLGFLRYGWIVAIFLSSAVWALGHGGMVHPEWVKFLHVLGIGVILGLLMRRQGVESCIVVHGSLNLLAFVVPQP